MVSESLRNLSTRLELGILKDIDEIGFVYLTSRDVVRHRLVQKIVNAYEKYDIKAKTKVQK